MKMRCNNEYIYCIDFILACILNNLENYLVQTSPNDSTRYSPKDYEILGDFSFKLY